MKHIMLISLFSCLAFSSALALDGKPYEGTWSGHLSDGTPLSMTIPAGITSGASVTYSYNNQDQGPQTPTVQGKKVRLDNPSGTYIIVGPTKGSRMPFFWTNGQKKAATTLTKQ